MKTSGAVTRFFFAFVALSVILLTGAFTGAKPAAAQIIYDKKIFVPLITNNPPIELKNGDFEQGRVAWFETSLRNQVVIVDTTVDLYKNFRLPVRSGKWIAWLGGEFNENSSITQQVTVTREMPYLTYWHFIASLDQCTAGTDKDVARILVNSNVYVAYDLCKSTQTIGWKQMFFDLSAYAGQNITVGFSVLTDATENSNLFLEDVKFSAGPGSASASNLTEESFDPNLAGIVKPAVE